jgi:riboflavin synthase
MFTGIIQAVGRIAHIEPLGADLQLSIDTSTLDLSDVVVGDSIAVNGVCLTAIALSSTQFQAHVSQATLAVTTGLHQPQAVNLEKALRFNDRLGGHLVSGHVDGIGEVCEFTAVGDCWLLAVRAPHALSKYIAQKGSICINGVSLTVNSIQQDTFTVNIIPHTIAHTTIQHFTVGSLVNLEVDLIARYVDRMTQWSTEAPLVEKEST